MVTDTVAGQSQRIGYLTQTSFQLPAGTNVSYNGLVVHWNGGMTLTSDGSTLSSVPDERKPYGFCFDCNANGECASGHTVGLR